MATSSVFFIPSLLPTLKVFNSCIYIAIYCLLSALVILYLHMTIRLIFTWLEMIMMRLYKTQFKIANVVPFPLTSRMAEDSDGHHRTLTKESA